MAITTIPTTVPTEAWASFTMRIKGEVLLPGNPEYDRAREIKNAIYDKKPAAIIRAADAADVSRCVTFARQYGLPLSARGGGHSVGGHSINDGGIVIDTSAMKDIRVDAANKTAWAQSGVVAREYLAAVEPHGLVTPFGDAGSVGLAGITLGGGVGYLTRKYGLTIDNLLAVELVTADGKIVQASKSENPDLFWALRGGGGNFGVVTGFQYRLHELPQIYGGVFMVPATPEALKEYARLSLEAPEEFSTISMLVKAPPAPFVPEDKVGSLVLMMFVAYSGPVERGPEVFEPFRALGEPVAEMLAPMPISALYTFTEQAEQRGRMRVRNGFYREFNDEVIDAAIAFVNNGPMSMNALQIRPIGNGAMQRVATGATAFSHRQANFLLAILDIWEGEEGDRENSNWVDAFWQAIGNYRDGAYSNFLQDEGEARVRDAYSLAAFERLGQVKAKYDPTNLFKGNENIAPKPLSAVA